MQKNIELAKLYAEYGIWYELVSENIRRAQLEVLKQKRFQHPYYWSAFVLIGNWL